MEFTPVSKAEEEVLAAAEALRQSNKVSGIASASGLAASGAAASAVGLTTGAVISALFLPILPIVAAGAVGVAIVNRSRQQEKRQALEVALRKHEARIRPELVTFAKQVLKESSGYVKGERPPSQRRAESSFEKPANPSDRANG